VILHSL